MAHWIFRGPARPRTLMLRAARGRRRVAIHSVLISLTMIATVGLGAQRQVTFFASFVDTSSGQPTVTVSQDQIEVREDNVPGRVLRMEPISWPVKVELLLDNGIGVGSDNLTAIPLTVRRPQPDGSPLCVL